MAAFSKAALAGREYYEFLEREAEAEAIAKRVRVGSHDYDPVRERIALVWFGGSPPRWNIVEAGAHGRREKLLDLGVLYFGLPPWRRSCVVSVTGRLGELERFVSVMPPPEASFEFTFAYDCDDAVRRSPVVTRSRSVVAKRNDQRARWSRPGRQGELF